MMLYATSWPYKAGSTDVFHGLDEVYAQSVAIYEINIEIKCTQAVTAQVSTLLIPIRTKVVLNSILELQFNFG